MPRYITDSSSDSTQLKKFKSKRSESDENEPGEEVLKPKRKSKDGSSKDEKRRKTGKKEDKKEELDEV